MLTIMTLFGMTLIQCKLFMYVYKLHHTLFLKLFYNVLIN